MLYAVYTRLPDDPKWPDTAQLFRDLDDARKHCYQMNQMLRESRLIVMTMIDNEMQVEILPTPPSRKHNA
jgi:hypothetical protein